MAEKRYLCLKCFAEELKRNSMLDYGAPHTIKATIKRFSSYRRYDRPKCSRCGARSIIAVEEYKVVHE